MSFFYLKDDQKLSKKPKMDGHLCLKYLDIKHRHPMSFIYLIDDLNLGFHKIHGKNIVLREASRGAMRNENSFCNAIVFTHRPVRLYEKVFFRIARLSTLWNCLVRFGFFSLEYCGGDFVDIVKVYRGSIFKSLMGP